MATTTHRRQQLQAAQHPGDEARLGRRLSLSDILWLVLARPARDSSSVTLSRNAKGETQIEVTVRTADTEDLATPLDAERVAIEMYDRLRRTYPLASGTPGATPTPTPTPRAGGKDKT